MKIQGRSLGESLGAEDGYEGAASWVSRSRYVLGMYEEAGERKRIEEMVCKLSLTLFLSVLSCSPPSRSPTSFLSFLPLPPLSPPHSLSLLAHNRSIETEKQLAQKRAEQFDFQDEVHTDEDEEKSNNNNNKTKKKGPVSVDSHLKGVKVGHKVDEFAEVSGDVVLTLRDAPILAGGDVNEDADELESIMIAEKERLQKKKEALKKKPVYDVYDEKQKSLLAQYDEPKEPESFTLDGTGDVELSAKRRLEDVRKKLQQDAKSVYALEINKQIASEYMTEQEAAAKFKKKGKEGKTGGAKKKATRKKVKDEEDERNDSNNNNNENNNSWLEELTRNAEEEGSRDHGSRKRGVSAKAENEAREREEDREKREKNYAKALERATQDSKASFSEIKKEDEADEDVELSRALSRARELAAKKKSTQSIQSVAERMQQIQQQQQQQLKNSMQEEQDPNLVFSATTEFVQRIQPIEELLAASASRAATATATAKSKAQREKESAEADAMVEEDIAEHERMIKEQAKRERAQRQKQEQQEEKEREKESSMMDVEKERNGHEEEEEEEEDETVESVVCIILFCCAWLCFVSFHFICGRVCFVCVFFFLNLFGFFLVF